MYNCAWYFCTYLYGLSLNSLRPRQNGRQFPDDIFKCIFLTENVKIPIKNSLKFVPKGSINNIPTLVQIMARRQPGDKPLSEPMMVRLSTHTCVTRPQWVNGLHALLCIANNRHFLIWMTTVRQLTERRRSCVLTLKYTCICVYWWMRQIIHSTLIVVDRYLRLMGDKTIPDSAEPRLESFYPPFVTGIDLPHQGVVDSYSLR